MVGRHGRRVSIRCITIWVLKMAKEFKTFYIEEDNLREFVALGR